MKKFWFYQENKYSIKLSETEYKFEAYFSTGIGDKKRSKKYISLKHEDGKYVTATKKGSITAGRKDKIFKFELVKADQTVLTQFFSAQNATK